MLTLGSGLNSPDDILYLPSDGSVLVGEHGDGHIASVSEGRVVRLAQVVPEVEGIVVIDGTTYVADQYHARVVALTDTGVRTVLQLQPVASGANLDGMSIDLAGTGLVVPDSPHGTVLLVDTSGQVTSRVGGFVRPAGVAPDPAQNGYLIADENGNAVYELVGSHATRIAGGLPEADDVLRDKAGDVLVTLPPVGRVYDITSGSNLATGLGDPQGLDVDGAQNVLVTESATGRLDLIVRHFALTVPRGTVQLQPGEPVCFGVVRAASDSEALSIAQLSGAKALHDPGTGAQGEIVPTLCVLGVCTVSVAVQGPSGTEVASFSYRD